MYEGSNVNVITEQINAMRLSQQYEALVRLALPGNTSKLTAVGAR
jgi:flagellar basal body rod protein FlgC